MLFLGFLGFRIFRENPAFSSHTSPLAPYALFLSSLPGSSSGRWYGTSVSTSCTPPKERVIHASSLWLRVALSFQFAHVCCAYSVPEMAKTDCQKNLFLCISRRCRDRCPIKPLLFVLLLFLAWQAQPSRYPIRISLRHTQVKGFQSHVCMLTRLSMLSLPPGGLPSTP